ncbi:hypothetical protein [Sediminivirga luteola]|uniref:Uncharacterized protein n=1 Tax=Sediminivirga luteola TaxID=1774748 RepID=A0A8J2TVC1_9MICO|nr:hypothetical protein [Sediminivirga luteola]GGA03742.1 hypothetical protein GCM10011333_03120 [Sediminivirga luteola]
MQVRRGKAPDSLELVTTAEFWPAMSAGFFAFFAALVWAPAGIGALQGYPLREAATGTQLSVLLFTAIGVFFVWFNGKWHLSGRAVLHSEEICQTQLRRWFGFVREDRRFAPADVETVLLRTARRTKPSDASIIALGVPQYVSEVSVRLRGGEEVLLGRGSKAIVPGRYTRAEDLPLTKEAARVAKLFRTTVERSVQRW